MTSLIKFGVFFVLLTNGAIGRFLPQKIFGNISDRSDDGELPDNCNCEWRFYKHYETKGCHIVQRDSCGCPTNYLCAPVKQSTAQEKVCMYQSEAYKIGEKIRLSDNCQVCRCVDGTTPHVVCRHRECPQLDPVEGENCHLVYEENKCCPSRYECLGDMSANAIEASAVTCVYDNVTYPLGAKIYPPDDPCLICECREDWNGINNASCYQQECVFERKKHLLDVGCIPVYHERKCCPIEYYCPEDHSSNMELRELSPENSTENGDNCIFDGNSYEIGAELSLNKSCVKCNCQVPPDFTCVHQSCPLPPSAGNCVEVRVAGQCCPTYDCLLGDGAVTEISSTEEGDPKLTTAEGNDDVSTIEDSNSELPNSEDGNSELSNTEDANSELPNSEDGNSELSNTEDTNSELSNTEDGNSELSDTEVNTELFTTEQNEGELSTTEGVCPTPMCADSSCRIEIPPGHECPTCVCGESREKNDFEPLEQYYAEGNNKTQDVKDGNETISSPDDSENELLSQIFIENLAQQNSNFEELDEDIEPIVPNSETELQTEESTFPETEEYFIQFQSHDTEDVENHLAPNELRQKRSENLQTAEIQSQQQWNTLQEEDDMETSETVGRERECSEESNEGFDEIKAFKSKEFSKSPGGTVELEDTDFDNVRWTSDVPGCPTPLCADSSCRVGVPQGHQCPTCICKKLKQP